MAKDARETSEQERTEPDAGENAGREERTDFSERSKQRMLAIYHLFFIIIILFFSKDGSSKI